MLNEKTRNSKNKRNQRNRSNSRKLWFSVKGMYVSRSAMLTIWVVLGVVLQVKTIFHAMKRIIKVIHVFVRSSFYWLHCVKSVQIRSFFWPAFSCIQTEYGDLWKCSVRVQENVYQKKLRMWTLFT